MGTARRSFVATLVAVTVVACALALWQLRALLALFLLGLVIAAAMRPAVEWLRRHHVPGAAGVALHYLVLLGLVALFLWFVVPRAIDQLSAASGGSIPTSKSQLQHEAAHSTGIKHEILSAVNKKLKKLPSGAAVIHPAISAGKTAIEVFVGIFFTFATAAYWVFERDRARRLVVSIVPRRHRRVVHDTWELIDLKLGAFVRGELLLVCFVGTVLSVCFWLIGEPYWLLVGIFAGLVELIPIVGPIAAGVVAIAVGFSASWHIALFAGIAVTGVRLLEDYIVVPKLLGHAVGLSPLVVLVAITALGLLLGGLYVLLAIPLAAILGTLLDVIVRDRDPGDEEVPTVIFPAQDRETIGR
ncbi:MAG TPA: AI-2E family transporter [Gaiellaceae bacterium]|nr:AI-2E family transporter [Gaiellaceae bacterium]